MEIGFYAKTLEAQVSPAAIIKSRRSPGRGLGYVPALDGLRGIAILLVMAYHFTTAYIHAFSGFLYQVSNFGWCGVDLFFVLSGFLITGILCDAKDDKRFFQKFYMRRLLRIFPLYYGFLFVLFIVLPLLHHFSSPVQHHMGEQVWLWTYLTNFDYCFSSNRPLVNQLQLGHFWSLAVEEQFYLIWPAIIFYTKPKTAMRICLICIGSALLLRFLLVVNHVDPLVVFNLTPCRMDSLAVGALCALLVRAEVSLSKLLKATGLITVLAGVGLACMCHWGESQSSNPVMQSVGYSILALFFGGILLLSLNPSKNNILAWLLSCPLLVVFGFYSYGIYVFHNPLIRVFNRWFSVRDLSSDFHSPSLGLVVHVLCSILVSLLVAVLSWNLYESHFLKLKDRFVLKTKDSLGAPNRQIHTGSSARLGPKRIAREFGLWLSRRPFNQ